MCSSHGIHPFQFCLEYRYIADEKNNFLWSLRRRPLLINPRVCLACPFCGYLFYGFISLHATVFAQATARRVSGLFTCLLNNCLLGSNDRLTSHQQTLLWLQLFTHSHSFLFQDQTRQYWIVFLQTLYFIFWIIDWFWKFTGRLTQFLLFIAHHNSCHQLLNFLRWIKFVWRNWIWISAVKPQINAVLNQAKFWIFTSFTFKWYAMGIFLDPTCCGANLLHAITGLPKLSDAMRLEPFELSVEMFAWQLYLSGGRNVAIPTDSLWEGQYI